MICFRIVLTFRTLYTGNGMIASWFQKDSASIVNLWQRKVITWEIIMRIYVERAMNFWSKTLADKRNTGMCGWGKLYKGDLAIGFSFPQKQGALRTPKTAEPCKAGQHWKSSLPSAALRWARLVGLGDRLPMRKTRLKVRYGKGNTGWKQSRIVFWWSP